ncbi:MAG: hypothetical protein B7X41_14935, partial [Microbacterium sp. 14-71-5]
LGGWWVALSVLALIVILLKAFTVDWVEIDGPALSIPLPADFPCVSYGEAQGPAITCRTTSMSNFGVFNVSAGIHALVAVAQTCTLIVSTLPAALIAFICFQTLRGRAFHRTVIRALVIGAIVLLVVGVAGDLLNDITGTLALREVFPVGSPWYPEAFMLSASGLPIGGAIALAALAAVFHQGFRLQSERDQLQKDTEGLV